MKLNYSIIFLSGIFYFLFLFFFFFFFFCRTDIADQGQTTQSVQSDVGSTLSVKLEDVFLSNMQLLNGNIQDLTLKALFDLFCRRLTLFQKNPYVCSTSLL